MERKLIFWILLNFLISKVYCACADCDPGSTVSCTGGLCTCLTGVQGPHCTSVQPGYYIPDLDYHRLSPVDTECQLITPSASDVRAGAGETVAVCDVSEGTGSRYVRFQTLEHLKHVTDVSVYRIAVRHQFRGNQPSIRATLEVRTGGPRWENHPDSSRCPLSPDLTATYHILFQRDVSEAFTSHSFHRLCAYTFTLTVSLPDSRNLSLTVDSLILIPQLDQFIIYQRADAATKNEYVTCLSNYSNYLREEKSEICHQLSFSVMAELLKQVSDCECSSVGSVSKNCSEVGGQCTCKPGTGGRTCDHCLKGFINFSAAGCEECGEGGCAWFVNHPALMGVVTVICLTLIAVLSLFLIMFLPTSKYGRLCLCPHEEQLTETDEPGLKIQRTYSVRANLETAVNMTMAPIGLQQENEPQKAEALGFKRKDSLKSIAIPKPGGGTNRQKGRNKGQEGGGAPKTTARIGSGLGAVGV